MMEMVFGQRHPKVSRQAKLRAKLSSIQRQEQVASERGADELAMALRRWAAELERRLER